MAQPIASGFVRLSLKVPGEQTPTPGEVVQVLQSGGVPLDAIGTLTVDGAAAHIDVLAAHAEAAQLALGAVGRSRVSGLRWQWLKLLLGRNHGFTINRLRTLMADCELGRINLNNTHTMVGIPEVQAEAVSARLAAARINGRPVRFELLPPGTGPGDPRFVPMPRPG